jgi:hypothetical protein
MNDFNQSAQLMRTVPVASIVTSNLGFHFDPALAKNGISPLPAGCASTAFNALAMGSMVSGVLVNYASCGATEGWNGTGTSPSPYELTVKGTDENMAFFDHTSAYDLTSDFTVDGWVKITTSGGFNHLVTKCVANCAGAANRGWEIVFTAANTPILIYTVGGGSRYSVTAASSLTTGRWHYVAGRRAAGVSRLFIDGVADATTTTDTAAVMDNNSKPIILGAREDRYLGSGGSVAPLKGALGPVRLYTDDLTDAQIKQNYLAQAHRYLAANISSVSSLIGWYRADAGTSTTTDGAAVSAWNDQSASVNNLSQGSATLRPLYIANCINGRPCLRFDGTNDVMQSAAAVDFTTSYSMFIVTRNRTRKNFNGIVRVAPAVTGVTDVMTIYWQQGTTDANSGNLVWTANTATTVSSAQGNGAGPPTGGTMLLSGIITNAATFAIRMNGATILSSYNVGSNIVPATAQTLWLGTGYNASYLDGDIAEVIVVQASVSNTDRDMIEAYLASKYGIALP